MRLVYGFRVKCYILYMLLYGELDGDGGRMIALRYYIMITRHCSIANVIMLLCYAMWIHIFIYRNGYTLVAWYLYGISHTIYH